MKQSKKFAVTGGIGSGKSVVLDLLRQSGQKVFSCDAIVKEFWALRGYREELALLFPSCAADGEIDRVKLTALVFSDPGERRRLEQFSHPRVMTRLMEEMEREECSFAEVPLLFEGGYQTLFDGVLFVKRDPALRIEAVEQRDRCTREEVAARMAAQWQGEIPQDVPVCVVENNGTKEELASNLKKALHQLGI